MFITILPIRRNTKEGMKQIKISSGSGSGRMGEGWVASRLRNGFWFVTPSAAAAIFSLSLSLSVLLFLVISLSYLQRDSLTPIHAHILGESE